MIASAWLDATVRGFRQLATGKGDMLAAVVVLLLRPLSPYFCSLLLSSLDLVQFPPGRADKFLDQRALCRRRTRMWALAQFSSGTVTMEFHLIRRAAHSTFAKILAVAFWCAPLIASAESTAVHFEVGVDWLHAHRNDPNLRILDLRSEADYAKSHIEGAVNVPILRLFRVEGTSNYVAPVAQVQDVLGAAGIDNKTLVAVYDAGEFVNASRAFWVLEVYGHDRVVVLDGGYAAWMQGGQAVSNVPYVPERRAFVPTVSPNRLATKLATRLAVDRPASVIVDARENTDYRGEKSAAKRFGHIQSAVNIPAKGHFDVVNGVKQLQSKDKLAAYYKDLDRNKKIITYCNIGMQSSSTYFVLRKLGYDVANYDGSWTEWGNDQALPIVQPAQPPAASSTPTPPASAM